jgi:hypothetical protein
MLQQQFIQLIKKPYHIASSQMAELEVLINEYPFFESAHLLYTKGLHEQNAINYSKQLRKTAIVANSRAVLYELIHQKVNRVVEVAEEVSIKTNITETIVEQIITEKEAPKEIVIPEVPISTSPITITNNDIKVIYVNTVSSSVNAVEKEIPRLESVNNDIAILKDIENETEAPIEEPTVEAFNEEKLNTQIQSEINRGIIQSYVETDIIKTPELNKEEPKEPISFTDWLNRVKKESGTIQKTEVKTEKEPEVLPKTDKKPSFFEQNKGIIDKIIESDPGRIKLGNQKFFTPNIDAKQSLLENEHLVTETLAKIYALQGNNSKAIRAYEILSLKFPQKSVYFTTLIEKLKSNK